MSEFSFYEIEFGLLVLFGSPCPSGITLRPFAFTEVAVHALIHLLPSEFSLFIWTTLSRLNWLPIDFNTYLLSSKPGERRHGPNEERKTALQPVVQRLYGNPYIGYKCKMSLHLVLTTGTADCDIHKKQSHEISREHLTTPKN